MTESPHDAPRVILHADMDAFYASVEQRDHPELRGRPIAVGGSGPRGVVSAASYEARRFGVRSAMPGFEARRLCPELVFVPGRMSVYGRESRRIFEIFSEFSPRVEGLSLDEAFLDLTGTRRLLGPPVEVGHALRARVREETGLAVSIGIAPVKMVAKIASAASKPDGLLEVLPEEVADFLAPLPVRRLWGIGPVAEERLVAAGFQTLGDLARASDDVLQKKLGDGGPSLGELARGGDGRRVESHRAALSISEENTFERDISERAVLEKTLQSHAEAVARRVRRSGLVARTVVLKWCFGRRVKAGPRGYPVHTRRVTLPEPTDDGLRITKAALGLLGEALAEPVRLLGVGVTGLEVPEGTQLPLFGADGGAAPTGRDRRLNTAIDALNERFGRHTVVRGHEGEVARAALHDQVKRGEADDVEPKPEGRRG